MTDITALIVDDEVHARSGLRTLLNDAGGVRVVGEAGNAAEAVSAIAKYKPDLVFLDIEMPDRHGFDVIAEVGPGKMPAVVFVTAYDEYAVAAFEASAVDYLLKPFTDERFALALERARRALQERNGGDIERRLRDLLGKLAPGAIDRFTVRVGNALHMFEVDDIDWVEAEEYYSKLHIGKLSHLIRQTMASLEEHLPADRFVRIHRSTIVNISRVKTLEPTVQGDCFVVLKDGTRLRMSRRRRDVLESRLTHFS